MSLLGNQPSDKGTDLQTKKFNTRIGDLFFDHDYPTNPTVQHLYDNMDYQRACQLYLWALPIVGVARWRQAYQETLDLQPNQAVLTKTFQDRLMVFDERHPGVLMYEGWRMVLGGERGDGIYETQRMEHCDTFDPRSRYTYEAICTSEVMCNPRPGRGMAYMAVFQDRNREWLKGEQSYRLRVPTDVPASLFWSAVCYDNRTRTLIDTDQQAATVGKKTENLCVNDDGSVDVLYVPESPGKDWESNWIKTIPVKGWFVYFRLYGVQQAFFDKTWQLALVERVNFKNFAK